MEYKINITKNKLSYENLSLNMKYFSQISLTRKIVLEDNIYPNAIEVISNVIDYEVMDMKILNDSRAVSYEGEFLSGKKILITIKFKEKIMYISDDKKRLFNIIESEFYNIVPIIIDIKIDGIDIKKLMEKKLLRTRINIEHSNIRLLDKRTLVEHLFCLIEIYKI